MFRNIFEAKIGEKLNNFNNSGKSAIEWMDKFRQSLDITEKIQQQFNYGDSSNSSSSSAQASTSNGTASSLPSSPAITKSGINGTTRFANGNANGANNTGGDTASGSGSSLNSSCSSNLTLSKKGSTHHQHTGSGSNSASNNNPNVHVNGSPSHFANKLKRQESQEGYSSSNGSSNNKNNNSSFLYGHNNSTSSDESQYNSQGGGSGGGGNNSPPVTPQSSSGGGSQQSATAMLLTPTASLRSRPSPSSSHHRRLANQSSLNSQASSTGECDTHSLLQHSRSNGGGSGGGADECRSQGATSSSNDGDAYSHASSSYANSKKLVRQSTDLTSSFPLKSFQKINSETVEIPGLNVKVVRYRIENDLGKIEPHLYINKFSGGCDATTTMSKGKLYFTLHYNEEIQSFSVTIGRAEIQTSGGAGGPAVTSNSGSLSAASGGTMSAPSSPSLSKPDSYVKVQLLPDKKRKFQTKIQRKTHAPLFDETFYFQLPFDELATKTLYLTLLEFGRFSKHELIGAVRLGDLHVIKDLSSTDVEFARNLIPLAEDDLELGELTLTLCYLPAAGRLTVTVVKAINLKAMDINGKSDPYVKVTLVSRGKRVKKKKTSVMKNTLHPVYNESMLFDIPQDQIETVDMIVKVIDYDRVGSNELIGCIGIGPSFSGIGRDHWYRMLENPRKTMTQAYFLRDANFLREGLPAKIEKALHSDQRQESVESRNSD